jgi:hypothetical protein
MVLLRPASFKSQGRVSVKRQDPHRSVTDRQPMTRSDKRHSTGSSRVACSPLVFHRSRPTPGRGDSARRSFRAKAWDLLPRSAVGGGKRPVD